MFGIIADLISSVLTILFPIYASYKALRTRNPDIIVPWLMYWVVIAIFTLVEDWTYWLVSWTPFYAWLRLAFLSYLVLPHTQGAKVLYQTYLDPWLYAHEDQIEEAIVKGHDYARRMGAQYMEQAIDFVRAKLGLPPIDRVQQHQQQQQQQQAAQHAQQGQQGQGAGGLASALLARFNMPAGGQQDAGSGSGSNSSSGASTGADLLNTFASGLSGLAARVNAAKNADAGVLPDSMRNASPDDQAQYLRERKEELANVMRAYDTAQHDLSGAQQRRVSGGSTGSSGSSRWR